MPTVSGVTSDSQMSLHSTPATCLDTRHLRLCRVRMWHVSKRRLVLGIMGSVLFRWLCFAAMTAMAVWNEARPAPGRLPDLVLPHVPYLPWVHQANLALWLLAWISGALVLLALAPYRFIRYMISGGILSLLRGLCLMFTGLGPIRSDDIHAGMGAAEQWQTIYHILNPISVFFHNAYDERMLKDLFFSGHAASTFLLLLYVWPIKPLRYWTLFMHVLVILSIFFAHLHYTIDVVAAYAFAFVVFALREGKPAAGLQREDMGPGWRR